MKKTDVFEKASMPGIVIPLAGFIAAASLLLLIVFAAAYGGAFTQMSEGG